MHVRARLASLLVIPVVAVLLAACGGPQAATTEGPLVTAEVRGGECPAGACATMVTLERDGRVHVAAKPPNVFGVVPPADLARLAAAIASTDFAALRAHPFSGECPTAVDGQEYIFEFGAPRGLERISTCEVQVDFGQPIFVALSTALGPFVPLPTT